jgi:hypothetical protein
LWYTFGKRKGGYVLKDRMEKLMKSRNYKTEEERVAYADGCLDMFNEAVREYEEVFAEQSGGIGNGTA